ncbi:TRAP transporter small permease subunit [Roseospira navarrensis]|uniref:TRAP transporter small permease protein n=1 Tax=Roseospira navarrensis TaxID=140058 RepID=A0A7X2D493_9PROT|nr:TRAP transporter small permease subunit [Roseospira navarrensis]MQX38184.1 TRAP transporter small permease subunit [Roseospira navarrensis]
MLKVAAALDAVNIAVGRAVRWAALLMVLLQFGIVLLRYVFGVSYIFLTESVLYLHGLFFMLGAGYTLLVDRHVRVDIFYARLTERGRAAIDVLGAVAFLFPAVIALGWFAWPSVFRSWMMLEGSISVGGIPASFLLKSTIPAFCALLAVQGLACLLRDLVRLRGGHVPTPVEAGRT